MLTKQQIINGAKKYKCDLCGDEFFSSARSPAYCSSACKQQAYLARRSEGADAPASPDVKMVTMRREHSVMDVLFPARLPDGFRVVDHNWWTKYVEVDVPADDIKLILQLKKQEFYIKKI